MFSQIPDLPTLALLLALAAAAGYVRGFSGFGAGLLFMPTASALLGPQLAVPTFFLMDIFVALPLIPKAVKKADWSTVLPLLIFAIISVPLGTYTLLNADVVPLRWAISLLIFGLVILLMSGWRYTQRPSVPVSAGVGLFAGFLNGAFQIGGPPVVTYWMSGPSKPDQVRANLISFFALSSLATGATYLFGGIFEFVNLGLLLILAPVYGLCIWFGANRFVSADETLFRRLVYILIAISAVSSLPALDSILRAN